MNELTETIRECNQLAREEMALVISDEFTENLSKVVDDALDGASIGRDILGGDYN